MSSDTARPRRSRKSIAVMPTTSESATNKENTLSLPQQPAKNSRKARSKSLGPGGLDALNEAEERKRDPLKDGSGNGRRASLVPSAQVRSILKPTLPVSPIRPIPAHKPKPQQQQQVSAPTPPPTVVPSQTLNFAPPQTTAAPTTIPIRTEEEQQRRAQILAARAARRQSLGNRRVSFAPEATLHTWDADFYRGEDGSSTPGSSRGGSNVSTPASNRRKSDSSLPPIAATPTPSERPATPPEQVEHEPPETPPNARTEHQKKNRRATQTPPLNFNNPDDEYTSSSPFSSSPVGENQSPFAGSEVASSDTSDSLSEDSDGETAGDHTFISAAGDDTMRDNTGLMDVDEDATTTGFKAFKKPMAWKFEGEPTAAVASSPPIPTTTEEQRMPEEDDVDAGEITMDVTRPVGGLLKAAAAEAPSQPALSAFSPKQEDGGEMTMDITRPLGGLLQRDMPLVASQEEEDLTMDITRPMGGILNAAAKALEKAKRRSLAMQPSDDSDTEMSMDNDTTMDITRPLGGIINSQFQRPGASATVEQQEDTMDMDFTRPLGGILAAPSNQTQPSIPEVASPTPTTTSEMDNNEEMTMEFTSVLGGIVGRNLSPGSKTSTRRSSLGARRKSGGTLMSGDAWAKDQAERQLQKEESHVTANSPHIPYPALPAETEAPSPVMEEAAHEPENVGDETEEDIDIEGVTMDITSSIGAILSKASKEKVKSKKLEEPPKSASATLDLLEEGAATGSPTPRRKNSSRRSSATSVASEKRVTRRSSAARKSMETARSSSPVKGSVTERTPSPKKEQTVAKANTPVKSTVDPPRNTTPEETATPQQPATPQQQLTPLIPSTKPKTPSKDTPRLETPVRSAGDVGFSLSAKKRLGFQASPSPVKLSTTPKLGTPGKGHGIDRPGLGSPVVAAKLSRRKSLGEDAPIFSPVAIPSELLRSSQEDKEREEQEEREEKARRQEEQKKLDLRSRIELLTPRKAGRKSIAFGALLNGKRPSDETLASGSKRRRSLDGGRLADLEEDEELLSMSARKFGRNAAVLPTPGSGRKKTPKRTPKKTAVVRVQTPTKLPLKSPAKTPTKTPAKDVTENKENELGAAVAVESHQENDENEEEEAIENISIQNFLDVISITFMDGLTATKRRHTVFGNKRDPSGLDETEEASFADCVVAGACTVPMLDLFQHSCRELRKYIKEGREVVREIERDTLDENPLLFREYLYAPPDVRLLMDSQFKDIKTHARLQAKGIWYDWRMKLLEGVRGVLETNLKGMKEDEGILKRQRETLEPMMPEITQRWNEVRSALDKALQMKKRIERDDQEELRAARDKLVDVYKRIESLSGIVQEKRNVIGAVNEEIKVQEARKEQLRASIEEAERVKELNRGWSEEEVIAWKEKCESLEKQSGWSITRVLDKSKLEMTFMKQLKLIYDPQGSSSPAINYILPTSQRPSDLKNLMPEAERIYFIDSLNKLIADITNSKKLLKTVSSYWKNALAVCENIRRLRMHHPISVTRGEQGQLIVKATVLVQELRSKMEISFTVEPGHLETVATDVRVVYGGISSEAVKRMLMEWEGRWREGVDEVVGKCLEDRRRGGIVVAAKSG